MQGIWPVHVRMGVVHVRVGAERVHVGVERVRAGVEGGGIDRCTRGC